MQEDPSYFGHYALLRPIRVLRAHTARLHLEEAQQDNAKLHSELDSLRVAFAEMQSQLLQLNPSASTPVQQW